MRGIIIGWTLLALGALAWTLAVMEIDRTPSPGAGAANLSALAPYWIASGAVWLGLTALWGELVRTRRAADRGCFRRDAMVITLVAVAARALVLFTHTPALSDDVYRYVVDGRNLAAGHNPYMSTPAERIEALRNSRDLRAAERWPGEHQALARVNNPELHTIYLPASQWTFGLIATLAPHEWTDPERWALAFRGAFVLLDLVIVGLLLLALRRRRRRAWWAALYAWHPLVLTEIAGSGHQDVIGLALFVTSLVLFTTWPTGVLRWTAALAPAVLVKPFVLPAAALMLRRRPLSRWLACATAGAVICLTLGAPLWLSYDMEPLQNLRETATRFSLKWAHFGSVYEPLLWTIERATSDPDPARGASDGGSWTNDDQERLTLAICSTLVIVVVLAAFLSRLDAWAASRVILLAMVLFTSTAHPWYLLWALALAPVAISPALWMLSLTLPWGYAILGDVVGWRVSPVVMFLAYGPVYAALIADLLYRRFRAPTPLPTSNT